jgi:hypothetical protein
MVGGAICKDERKITAAAYQKMLEDEIFGIDLTKLLKRFIFQQDNAPVHFAHQKMTKGRKFPS